MGRVERISKPIQRKGVSIIQREKELKRIQTEKATKLLKNTKH